jgi:hypothetical protein
MRWLDRFELWKLRSVEAGEFVSCSRPARIRRFSARLFPASGGYRCFCIWKHVMRRTCKSSLVGMPAVDIRPT